MQSLWLKFCACVLSVVLLAGGIIASAQTQQRPRVTGSSETPQKKPTTAESDDEVIRVNTNLVTTLFTAVDQNRQFITSLRSEDVRILENDVVQPVSIFERETDRPLSLALLIDTSESQTGVLADEKRAARIFIDQVIRPSVDRATIISFTGASTVEQSLTNDLAQLHQGIEKVKRGLSQQNQWRMANDIEPLPKEVDASGYTGIWDAMWDAVEHQLVHTPEGSRRAIILLSDGDDTSSKVERQQAINYAVQNDVVVYGIAVRDPNFPEGKLDSGALKKVSERTGGRAFFPKDSSDLNGVFAQIDRELRSQYLIAYSPTNSVRDGSYRRIKIEVVNPELRKNKVQLMYRQGYYARKN